VRKKHTDTQINGCKTLYSRLIWLRHAELLPWTICLPSLVLIAQAVILLERGQTNKQMRLNALLHAGGYTSGVGNNATNARIKTKRLGPTTGVTH